MSGVSLQNSDIHRSTPLDTSLSRSQKDNLMFKVNLKGISALIPLPLCFTPTMPRGLNISLFTTKRKQTDKLRHADIVCMSCIC